MCYNCGCIVPDYDRDDPRNITEKTFEQAAKANGESVEQTMRNVLELLKVTLRENQHHHPVIDSLRKRIHLHHS